MKNIRFNQVTVGGCRYLKTKLRPNDSLNNQVIDMIFDNSGLHILPITACTEYDGIIEVLLGDYISLDKMIKNNINRQVFLTILFNLIKELSGLVRKGIKLEYIVLNKRYLYINPVDLSTRFICIPVDNIEHKVDFKIFLRGLLACARYDNSDNLEYIGQLLDCINSSDYTNTKLVQLMREIGGEDIGAPMKYEYNDMPIGAVNQEADSAAGEITEVNMFDGEIEDHELAKQFEILREESTSDSDNNKDNNANKETAAAKEEFVTTLSDGEEKRQENRRVGEPYLVRVSTREMIPVNKERFNLGKSPMSNHYVIDNERVSRYHCAIVYRNGRYYIKDNGSTNCTYVNGIDIGDMAVELIDNTKIHTANEEFIFIFQ